MPPLANNGSAISCMSPHSTIDTIHDSRSIDIPIHRNYFPPLFDPLPFSRSFDPCFSRPLARLVAFKNFPSLCICSQLQHLDDCNTLAYTMRFHPYPHLAFSGLVLTMFVCRITHGITPIAKSAPCSSPSPSHNFLHEVVRMHCRSSRPYFLAGCVHKSCSIGEVRINLFLSFPICPHGESS